MMTRNDHILSKIRIVIIVHDGFQYDTFENPSGGSQYSCDGIVKVLMTVLLT
jgi:hypothetical protein